MPWYLAFLLPVVEYFGKIALKYGLQYLENKYPGVKPILDLIISWLGQQQASGNPKATEVLNQHVSQLCSGTGCAPELKKE